VRIQFTSDSRNKRFVPLCIYTNVHIRIHIYYTYIYTFTYVHTYTYVFAYICQCIHLYTYVYILHTRMYIYICICVRTCIFIDDCPTPSHCVHTDRVLTYIVHNHSNCNNCLSQFLFPVRSMVSTSKFYLLTVLMISCNCGTVCISGYGGDFQYLSSLCACHFFRKPHPLSSNTINTYKYLCIHT